MAQYNKGIATHNTLLKVAKNLFYDQGYEATTTRQIAKESGVNLGLIKYHFASKGNIALEIYSEIREVFCSQVTSKEQPINQRILIDSAIEFVLCFNSPNYLRFLVEIFRESKIQHLFQSRILSIDGISHRDDATYKLHSVAFSAMKPSLLAYAATEEGQKIDHKQYILYYMNQQINAYHLTDDPDMAEKCYAYLQKYYLNIVDNFTPVIIPIQD